MKAAPSGTVAVVTGASRGVGCGIDLALGEAGATVYLTGRSRSGNATEYLPGIVEESAEAVTARGGRGIQTEHGRLDVLVHNVWGGYEQHEGQRFVAPFWEQPLRHWEGMFTAGVRAHLVASRLAVPLMLPAGRGLIIHTTAWDRDKYFGNVFYDVAKVAVNRMAYGMARELRPHGIAVVSLAPGFVRPEPVEAEFAAAGRSLQENLESPEHTGRAVVALASDGNVLARSGQTLTVGEWAREYGFTDVDGRQLPPFHIEL